MYLVEYRDPVTGAWHSTERAANSATAFAWAIKYRELGYEGVRVVNEQTGLAIKASNTLTFLGGK